MALSLSDAANSGLVARTEDGLRRRNRQKKPQRQHLLQQQLQQPEYHKEDYYYQQQQQLPKYHKQSWVLLPATAAARVSRAGVLSAGTAATAAATEGGWRCQNQKLL